MDNLSKTESSIISIATEAWRFRKTLDKIFCKLDMDDQRKYASQFRWFENKVKEALEELDLRTVNIEGQPYDIGMAVNVINLEDFEMNDSLIVNSMIEPIIMKGSDVVKLGSVVLGRPE